MPDIVLTTLNARYHHSSLGLRYLMANLGALQDRAVIRELVIGGNPLDHAEVILGDNPQIVGLGVYVWNADESAALVSVLKRVRPDLIIVLGGPEVSHEHAEQTIIDDADYVIAGEADLAFRELCEQLLDGGGPTTKIITAEPPSLDVVEPPYDLYTDEDIAHRTLYVEASRGCPFRCEFCLSSLDRSVRKFPLEPFLAGLADLLGRGAQQLKFVDRTFNLDLSASVAILEFFLDRYQPGLFLHFEMVPDRFPRELRAIISRFPAGSLQLEVGVQTFNPDVAKRISRAHDCGETVENLRFLRQETEIHVHADLVVGLPGETLESFGAGFDQLIEVGPQEIQVGILKRLRGAPISRHDQEWDMVYGSRPPYKVLSTRHIDFATMQRLRRFAQFFDRINNSGNFVGTAPLIWRDRSPFWAFWEASDWLFVRLGRAHAIALRRLAEALFGYLTEARGLDREDVAAVILEDYQRAGRTKDLPRFGVRAEGKSAADTPAGAIPSRQQRHLGK